MAPMAGNITPRGKQKPQINFGRTSTYSATRNNRSIYSHGDANY
jgi:hypothetical protein